MLTTYTLQRGTTLVELMIAGVIALIALAAVLSVYSATARHSLLQLENAHINQQTHSLLHLIGRDLKRAGYRAFDPALEPATANPFQNSPNHLRIDRHAREANGSCILFAYDLDKDGLVGVGACAKNNCVAGTDSDNVEQLGFRLKNRRLQSRYGGKTFDCNSGNWQAISDPGIEINKLAFTLHTQCLNLADKTTACTVDKPALEQRAVSVQVTARIHNKPRTQLELGQWLQVRNDHLMPGRVMP